MNIGMQMCGNKLAHVHACVQICWDTYVGSTCVNMGIRWDAHVCEFDGTCACMEIC